MKVRFLNVGRSKATWDQDIDFNEESLIRAIRKKGVLMSRGIDVEISGGRGGIFAGDRLVGEFMLLLEPASNN